MIQQSMPWDTWHALMFITVITCDKFETPKSRTYTVNEMAAILGIGCDSAYKLANSGLFEMIRISRKSFYDWLKVEGLE